MIPELSFDSYFSYLYARLRRGSFFSAAARWVKYSRLVLFFHRVIKTTGQIFVLLETGALLVLAAALLLYIIPSAAAAALLVMLAVNIDGSRFLKKLKIPENARILVFLDGGAGDLLRGDGETVCIVVADRGRFLSAKREGAVIYCRRSFFFRFRRRVLKKHDDRTVYLV